MKEQLRYKSRTIDIVILNTKWKDCESRKNLCTKHFTYTKKYYVHEIATVNLSKIYFLKNACKPSKRDLNHDWMSNSAQLKDRELRLIILELFSSAALECAVFVCFLRKLCVRENIGSKFVKPWEMKRSPWDLEKGSETVWHTVKPWELRGL